MSSLTLKHRPGVPRMWVPKISTGHVYTFIKREAYKMRAQLVGNLKQFCAIWLLDVLPGALGTAPFNYNPSGTAATVPLLNTANALSSGTNFIVARTAYPQHSEALIIADMPNNNLRPTVNTQTVLCYSWFVPCSMCAQTVCNLKANYFPNVPNFIVAYSNRYPPNPTRNNPDQTDASRATMANCQITLLNNALVSEVVQQR